MSLLLESIRIENQRLHHIELHNQRLNKARKALFGKTDFVKLEEHIQIPGNLSDERYKCRTITDGETIKVEINPYHQRQIKTLKVILMNNITYEYKTGDRSKLDKAFELRGDCDDIIIVKDGMVSDAWAANLIFFNGEKWITPSTPLLKGTQREYLLTSGKIFEKNIHLSDLHRLKSVKLINALIDFERSPEIDITTGITF